MRALLAILLLAVSTCGPSPAAGPEGAYRDFVRAVQRGEEAKAFAALSTPTRALLQKRASEISAASGGAIKDDPAELFFGGALVGAELGEVTLEQEDGQRAKVSAQAGGRPQEIMLVKEAGIWKVDLTDTLRD